MPNRISVEETKEVIQRGALLVCVYPDEKYKKVNLEGSISYKEFKSRLPSLDKKSEVIFY